LSKSKKAKKEKPLYDAEGNWVEEKTRVIGAIRRLFRQSPQFKEVHEESRVEVPRYNKDGKLSKKPHVKRTCQVCGEFFSSTNIAIDHIEPMVPLYLTNEDLDYNEIVKNIICKKSNLQRICNPKKGTKPKFLEFCHQKKGHLESFIRNKWKGYFEENGITKRSEKDIAFSQVGSNMEDGWKKEYPVYLEAKIKELEEKEKRKQFRSRKQ